MLNSTISPKLFHLVVAPVLSFLEAAIFQHNSDWHVRKFSARSHFLLSLFAQFARVESANALLEELNDVAQAASSKQSLRHLLDFSFIDNKTGQPVQLNQSSTRRANAHRFYQLWRTCFEKLWPLALQHLPITKFEGLGQVIVVDGSLFDCIARMAWAVYRTDCPKVKGHSFFNRLSPNRVCSRIDGQRVILLRKYFSNRPPPSEMGCQRVIFADTFLSAFSQTGRAYF